MKYLILFDIDGTILKLKVYYSREIFSKVLRDFFSNDIFIDNKISFKGRTDLEILRSISEKHYIDFKVIEDNLDMIWSKLLLSFKKYYSKENFNLIRGIDILLKDLSRSNDFLLGLQTGNFKLNAIEKLKVFGFDKYFEFGAFGSDFEDRKKLPPLAMKRANQHIGKEIFNETNTIIIGDSEADIICAESNNLPIILVNSDNSLIEHSLLNYADLVIRDYSNPENLISEIYHIFKKNEKN